MKIMTLEETKQVELEILTNVADFCDKHEIQYFLAYGTLIGAVRHKGFIPWDDDIDIWMPRADYNRFLKIYNKENSDSQYKVISPYDKISRHSFVKVIDTRTAKIESGIDYSNGYLGVDVDVFPLDGQPDDDGDFKKFYNKKYLYYKLHNNSISAMNFGSWKYRIYKLAFFGTKPFKNVFLRKCDNIARKYTYENSKLIGAVSTIYNSKKNRYKKDWFNDSITVDFENKKFKIPVGYDEILTQMYGDYMQLPPIEKQVTHHSNNTYWLED